MDYDDDAKDHRGFLRVLVDEEFYLGKEDGNDIFITREQTERLKRHQHRGLRFLYRQYKMKKPGVIMNDASGFGKKVQTAVFLDAIKYTLSQPALVLCNESERDNWKYYFMHFGRDYKEILSFDATLPTSDKKIFTRSFDDLETVIKKTWSIVVIDDPVAIKMFKPLKNLKAAFKIWVVSIDLKHNLNTFAAINDWINANNTFSIQDFTPKNKSVDEIIEKAIILDRYFEELVLSRGHEENDNMKNLPNNIKATTTTTNKKNKDSTGTKTKKTTNNAYKPNAPIASTSKSKTTVKRTSKGTKNSSDESWEETGAAKRKKLNKATNSKAVTAKPNKANLTPKPVTAKSKNTNKATSVTKAVTEKGTNLNKMRFGFDCDDLSDDDNVMSDFDEDESDFGSFTSDEDKGEARFLKAESKQATKRFGLTRKGVANKSLGSTKKGLVSARKGVGITKNISSAKSLQKQSEDLTKNKEDKNDNDSEMINDSEVYELNTLPMEDEDNVGNKSDKIVLENGNIESSNISKTNEEKQKNKDSKNYEDNKIIDNTKTKNSPDVKEPNKNNEQTKDTNKTDLSRANTSHSELDESIIDTKVRDLEEQTSAQFKGSILDQLLTSPRSSNSYKIYKKSEVVKKNDDSLTKSPKASISKTVGTEKPASPVIIAIQSPTKGSPQKIDDQIKALEQTTYDKFKGSVLDKLF